MKETLIKQIGKYSPNQTEWHKHIADCIAAEICPNCGHELFFDEGVDDKDLGEIDIFGCSNCNWEDYNPRRHHNENHCQRSANF